MARRARVRNGFGRVGQARRHVPIAVERWYQPLAMRFLLTLLVACVLLVSLANRAAAYAAVSPEPTASEMMLHHDGDGDEVSNCPFANGPHHHHSLFGQHQLAVPDASPSAAAIDDRGTTPALTRDFLPAGLHPASEPHPPKA